MNARTAVGAYKITATETGIEDASPHGLIAMLLDGAVARLSEAVGALDRNDLATHGLAISKAMSIVDNLRIHLDMENGGAIAQNLHDLYEYISRRLLEANLTSDPAMVREVTSLLAEIKDAWAQIPADLHHASE